MRSAPEGLVKVVSSAMDTWSSDLPEKRPEAPWAKRLGLARGLGSSSNPVLDGRHLLGATQSLYTVTVGCDDRALKELLETVPPPVIPVTNSTEPVRVPVY